MNNDLKYNLLIVLISIIINFILAFIVLFSNIPFLFMDSVGTILSAVILGPVYGAMVGIISNIMISFMSDSHLYFSIINAFIGLIVGLIAKKFKFNIISAIIVGLIIGVISPIMGAPISVILTEGFSGGTIDNFVTSLVDKGINIIEASFIARIFSNIFDKVLSSIIVYILLKKVHFFNKYLNIENNTQLKAEK